MRTIAIVNQKGGCGKTTTTVNLAGVLAEEGARVLVIDADPQAHASMALGVEPKTLGLDLYDVLADAEGRTRLDDIAVEIGERLHVASSGVILSALEQKLAAEHAEARTERLARAVRTQTRSFDYVLIDCPPTVGLLTFNALRAATEVIVPMETSFFAIEGGKKLLETICLLTERIGHHVTVRVLPTLYDGRTRYAREALAEIRETFEERCFDTVVRCNVALREAARRGLPICRAAPAANGALDYASLALEVLAESDSTEASDPAPVADIEPREVVIRYRDTDASDVRVAGDFNGWQPDRDVQSRVQLDGASRVWTKVLRLPPGTYRYRYMVDGGWREDPENPRVEDRVGGGRNSILTVP